MNNILLQVFTSIHPAILASIIVTGIVSLVAFVVKKAFKFLLIVGAVVFILVSMGIITV